MVERSRLHPSYISHTSLWEKGNAIKRCWWIVLESTLSTPFKIGNCSSSCLRMLSFCVLYLATGTNGTSLFLTCLWMNHVLHFFQAKSKRLIPITHFSSISFFAVQKIPQKSRQLNYYFVVLPCQIFTKSNYVDCECKVLKFHRTQVLRLANQYWHVGLLIPHHLVATSLCS